MARCVPGQGCVAKIDMSATVCASESAERNRPWSITPLADGFVLVAMYAM
jgi:hypothetical protein